MQPTAQLNQELNQEPAEEASEVVRFGADEAERQPEAVLLAEVARLEAELTHADEEMLARAREIERSAVVLRVRRDELVVRLQGYASAEVDDDGEVLAALERIAPPDSLVAGVEFDALQLRMTAARNRLNHEQVILRRLAAAENDLQDALARELDALEERIDDRLRRNRADELHRAKELFEAQDMRQTPRVPVEADLTFGSDDNFYTGLSADISCGGIFITTDDLLPIGKLIAVRLSLPETEPLVMVGAVRWIRPLNDAEPHVRAGMGIEFIDLDEEQLETIRAYTEERDPLFYCE